MDSTAIYLQQRRKLNRPGLGYDLIAVTEVVVIPRKEYPEFNLITGVEIGRYCYLEGYPERGSRLPEINPDSLGEHERGRGNGYILGADPGDWTRIDELVEPARGMISKPITDTPA
jgi:hypothetical protein